MNKAPTAALKCLVFVFCLCALTATACPFGSGGHSQVKRPFDSKAWQTAMVTSGYSPRIEMVDDLLKTRLKPGMTKSQVYSLLGKPDYQSQVDLSRGIDRYYLGYAKDRIQMDPKSLALKYDNGGRLVSIDVDLH